MNRKVMSWSMLVDRNRHSVAKIEGLWRMYCPARGTDSLIYAPDFHYVQVLMYTPCPHLDDRKWPLGGVKVGER